MGQTFPIMSLILFFPAIVLLLMLWKREMITINRGKEFLIGHAIYASEDKTAFAHPSGLGHRLPYRVSIWVGSYDDKLWIKQFA